MKVLYATDGGAPAKQALALLVRAATPEKTQITVVSVVGPGVDEMVESGRPSPAADAVASAAKQLQEAGFETEGSPRLSNICDDRASILRCCIADPGAVRNRWL